VSYLRSDYCCFVLFFFFFFQAEDGIRDFHVTGVQTCALPIFLARRLPLPRRVDERHPAGLLRAPHSRARRASADPRRRLQLVRRSEERRVGKECRSRWAAYH